MKTITIKEIKSLEYSTLSAKIIEAQKHLFELKFKQATKQPVKNHLFKKYKHMLAQMLTEQHKFTQHGKNI